MRVDRLVGKLAQRLDHVGAERDVRNKPPVHHVDMQPIGSRLQDLRHLVAQARQVGGQYARRDAHTVRHCGLCATTVPGEPSVVLRRVTVPSCSPSVSSLVRASADAMPSRSGTGIVGAPRLTTMVSPAPGASTVPAGGLVIMASPVGAAACTDSTWLTVSPAAATIDCASVASRPATSGTGIFGGPALDTRVTLVPSAAMTSGGGSCQITTPCGAVGCGSAPPGARGEAARETARGTP